MEAKGFTAQANYMAKKGPGSFHSRYSGEIHTLNRSLIPECVKLLKQQRSHGSGEGYRDCRCLHCWQPLDIVNGTVRQACLSCWTLYSCRSNASTLLDAQPNVLRSHTYRR